MSVLRNVGTNTYSAVTSTSFGITMYGELLKSNWGIPSWNFWWARTYFQVCNWCPLRLKTPSWSAENWKSDFLCNKQRRWQLICVFTLSSEVLYGFFWKRGLVITCGPLRGSIIRPFMLRSAIATRTFLGCCSRQVEIPTSRWVYFRSTFSFNGLFYGSRSIGGCLKSRP